MKFSIVTPSFNQADFIAETIESVLSQKGNFEIEYIVQDGGSKDKTIQIIKRFAKKVKAGDYKGQNNSVEFYYKSQKDKGQSDAINQGLKRATGDIIAYINSDDTYCPNAFRKVSAAFSKEPDKKWLTGYCRIVDENGKKIQKPVVNYKNFFLNRYSRRKLLILNFISQPSTFWRKDLLKKIGVMDEKLHYTMDYDYCLRLSEASRPAVIKDYLSCFRIHSSSKGRLDYIKQFNQDLETCQKYTKSNFTIFLHKLHNQLIKSAYKIIK